MLDEEQDVEDAPGPAVAVGERVDRLELVVLDREPDQRVEVSFLVHERGPVVELGLQQRLALGRGIDGLAGHAVFQPCSRIGSKIEFYTFDCTTNLYCHVGGQHAPLHHLRALEQRAAVAQCLLGGRVRLVLGDVDELEQLVRRRHDVLYLGARLRFEQGQGIDQHAGIRDQFRRLL